MPMLPEPPDSVLADRLAKARAALDAGRPGFARFQLERAVMSLTKAARR